MIEMTRVEVSMLSPRHSSRIAIQISFQCNFVSCLLTCIGRSSEVSTTGHAQKGGDGHKVEIACIHVESNRCVQTCELYPFERNFFSLIGILPGRILVI